MKRTWVIPGLLVAGLAGLGALTYAASAQDSGGRDGGSYSRGDGPRDDGRSGQRWRDDDRRGYDDRGPRWRRGDDDRGSRGREDDRGQRWRDGDSRGYGHREGRRGDDDRCGPRGRGWDRGEQGWRHHGRGYDRHHGYGRGGEDMGRREGTGRGYDRRDDAGRGYGRHGGRGGPGRSARAFDPARLDSVKKEIGVTPAQEQVWTAYTATLKQVADARKARRDGFDRGAVRRMSPDEHRKFRDGLIDQRRKEQDGVRASVDELVKSLDEKQVAIAKEVLPGYAFGPGMRGMGGGYR